MGRDAHVLRIALGRGADEPPSWASQTLQDRYHLNSTTPDIYSGTDSNNLVTFTRLYDSRGRPWSPSARELDERRCKAVNAVTALVTKDAGTNEEKETPSQLPRLRKTAARGRSFREPEANTLAYVAVTTSTHICLAWIENLRKRLLTWRHPNGLYFLDLVRNDFTMHGPWTILSNGVPSRILGRLLATYGQFITENTVNLRSAIRTLFSVDLQVKLYKTMQVLPPKCLVLGLRSNAKPLVKPLHSTLLISLSSFCANMILSVNAELQDLQVLPASSLMVPIPLLRVLRDLTYTELASCLLGAIIPSFVVISYRTSLFEQVAAGIRTALLHDRTSIALPSDDPEIAQSLQREFLQSWNLELLLSRYREIQFHQDVVSRGIYGFRIGDSAPALKIKWHSRPKLWEYLRAKIHWLYQTTSAYFGIPTDSRWLTRHNLSAIRKLPISRITNWPGLLSVYFSAEFLRDLALLPVNGILTRLFTQYIINNSTIRTIPYREALLVNIYPVLSRPTGMTTALGLNSARRFASRIAMTFVLQAGVLVALLGLESLAINQLARQKARLSAKSGLEKSRLTDTTPLTRMRAGD